MSHKMFLFDVNRCTGCGACVIACQQENHPEQMIGCLNSSEWLQWRNIYVHNPENRPDATSFALSLACNHCEQPACLTACPTAAYQKEPFTGAVLLNQDVCIGCRYCSWACPFDAPKYDDRNHVMSKCNFCYLRLAEDFNPSCVVACPTNALKFGDRSPTSSGMTTTISGFPRSTFNPSIRFTSLRNGLFGILDLPLETPARPSPKLSLAAEWPLWILTSTMTLSAAWFGSGIATISSPVANWGIFSLTGIGILASTAHLGKPFQAWRAISNVRTSWLSREILVIGIFMSLALGWLVYPWFIKDSRILLNIDGVFPSVMGILGLLMLLTMDRVYDVAHLTQNARPEMYRPRPHLHSAINILSGLHLWGFASGLQNNQGVNGELTIFLMIVGFTVGFIQLCLYATRRYVSEIQSPMEALGVFFRVVIGFFLPWSLLAAGESSLWLLGGVFLGMLMDRAEYYDDLMIISPGW